jgi:hypothetical protein
MFQTCSKHGQQVMSPWTCREIPGARGRLTSWFWLDRKMVRMAVQTSSVARPCFDLDPLWNV